MADILHALSQLPSPQNLWKQAGGGGEGGFKKRLGQNFIFDERLAVEIAALAEVSSARAVLEIGGGAGSLTRALLAELARGNSTAPLFVIEPDARAVACLQPLSDISGGRLQIIEGFAERQDFASFLPHGTAVVANLPYNVASVILLKLLENINLFSHLTLMFQEEVADRICAEVGGKDYGRLSVAVQFLCRAEKKMQVPAAVFHPPPKVDSAVVQLHTLRGELRQASFSAVQAVAKAAFSTRRKMLRKALQAVGGEALLAWAEIDGTRRAETLTIDEFDRLAAFYEKRTP